MALVDSQSSGNAKPQQQQPNQLDRTRIQEDSQGVDSIEYDRILGLECAQTGDYATATHLLAKCLASSGSRARQQKGEPPSAKESLTRTTLVQARLAGDNHARNINQAVDELSILIKDAKAAVTAHQGPPNHTDTKTLRQKLLDLRLAKVDALIRLMRTPEAARLLRETIADEQPAELCGELAAFYTKLAESSKPMDRWFDIDGSEAVEAEPCEMPVPSDKLSKFLMKLIPMARIATLNLKVADIHAALDDDQGIMKQIVPESLQGDERARWIQFLHDNLNWNSRARNAEEELFFIKSEIANQAVRDLWHSFRDCDSVPLKKVPAGVEEGKKYSENEKAALGVSHFEELGTFTCQDGLDFVSQSGIDGVRVLTQLLGLRRSPQKKQADTQNAGDASKKVDPSVADIIVVEPAFCSDIGLKLIEHLARCPRLAIDFSAEHASADWSRFVESRHKAHMDLEIKAAAALAPMSTNDPYMQDPDLFEKQLTEALDPDKAKHLLKYELKVTVPVLRKYAQLMSEISGIDARQLELELIESDKDEPKPELTPGSGPYEPIGLAVLLAQSDFKLTADDKAFPQDDMDRRLAEMERAVVRMQIDFRKEVERVAGEGFEVKLQKILQHLQFKGLELTKWLRGFVNYLAVRRVIEIDVIEQANMADITLATKWFESMQHRLALANRQLVAVVARLLLKPLQAQYHAHHPQQQQQQQESNAGEIVAVRKHAVLGAGQAPGAALNLKLIHREAVLQYIMPLTKFVMQKIVQADRRLKASQPQTVKARHQQITDLVSTFQQSHSEQEKEVARLLHVNDIKIPVLPSDLPTEVVRRFKTLDRRDNRLQTIQRHKTFGPQLRSLNGMLSLNFRHQGVVLQLVLSKQDGALTDFAAVPSFTLKQQQQQQQQSTTKSLPKTSS